jgi:alpha-glucosidase
VDGFRLDVVHRLSKGPNLQNGPRAHEFVMEIRRGVGEGALLLGEVWILDLAEVVKYLAPGELDLAFAFPFAVAPWNATELGTVIEGVDEHWSRAGAWPCWHIGNHDMPRPATRWGIDARRPAAVLQLTLPGAAVIYQGDELGMRDGDVPPERRRDRIGRDGCRTPMRWDARPNAGFCPEGVEAWLPVGTEPPDANVADQEADHDSLLALYRRLLALRARSPALNSGSFRMLSAGEGSLECERHADADSERLRIFVNMVDESRQLSSVRGRILVATAIEREGAAVDGPVVLGPNEAVVVRCDDPV